VVRSAPRVAGQRLRTPAGQRVRGALCAAVVAALLSRGGRAQEGDEARPELPQVERTTPPVLVEGVQPAELPEDPSSFTPVIEVEDFVGEAESVADLVADAPGVQVRRFGGPESPAEVSIRGSTSSQVVVLLDGVRLNSAQTGTVDLNTIPRGLVERIEIQRGGGGVQTGSDAIGGVINIITRRASAEPSTHLLGAVGSFDTWNVSASQTGRLRDTELVLGYDAFQTGGDWPFRREVRFAGGVPFPDLVTDSVRVNSEAERHASLLRVARDLGEHARVSLGDSFYFESAGRPGLDLGGGALAGQSTTGHVRRTRNVADLRLELADWTGAKLDGEARVFHRYEQSRYRDEMPPPALGLAPIDEDVANQSVGGRLSARGDAELGPALHAVSFGLESRGDFFDERSGIDVSRATLGVFVQDELRLFGDRLRLIPALRLDATQGFGPEWVPRLGAIYEPFSWLRFQGNVERSYRVPNFDELYVDDGLVRGNPSLQPEDALDADVGFELGFAEVGPVEDVELSLAWFRNDIENSIVFQLISEGVTSATDSGEALARGLELSGGFSLLGWLRFFGNYTHLDAHTVPLGFPLPGRAENEYLLRLELGPASRLVKLVGEARHTGEIPARPGGGTVIAARTVYDASLALDLRQLPFWPARLGGERCVFSVTGANLTDVAVRDAMGFPQPPRTLTFQLDTVW
jgi:outer membrane receptor protein involved in Fe transport